MHVTDPKLDGMKTPVATERREFVERLTYLRDKMVSQHLYQAAQRVNEAIAELEKA